jgi:hypothetical protein
MQAVAYKPTFALKIRKLCSSHLIKSAINVALTRNLAKHQKCTCEPHKSNRKMHLPTT